jgi:hypothetical protein
VTLFEYLAIAFSLVFSFTAARLVSGLPNALDSSRSYFVHYLFTLGLLGTVVAIFWAFWTFRTVEWDFLRFVLALASPGLLYFLACTLVPNVPEGVVSWRDHFFAARRRFYLGLAAWISVVAINNTISLGVPLTHPARALQAALFTIAMVGAVSEEPRVHAGLAIGSILLLLTMGIVVLSPGALAAG